MATLYSIYIKNNMIFKIDFSLIDLLLEKYPYIRYNDSEFYSIEESYYSKNKKEEIPWQKPKDVIIHRRTSNFIKDFKIDFEKDSETLKDFLKFFLDFDISKTFQNIRHYLIIGKKDSLKASEIINWIPIEEILNKGKYFEYLYMARILVRIPLGPLNINIVKILNVPDLFLEITSINREKENVDSLIQTLELKEGFDKNWTDLLLDSSSS